MKNKKPNLADAKLAVVRLLLLPEDYNDLTKEEIEFLRSDLVGEILSGQWPTVFIWRSFQWGIKRNTVKPS